ncbi:CHRD domain-containing protein [Geobacter sp. SVR]|uniref:CHRD domain-containing protein n=1 Tax=Geobacter sp. SVR TaxID=2495594 RepID=UPI00143F03B8|nr:CHRD domain-containing protein [Geobacter sp. SVR]BCS52951.1 CHRD domain-containing protein [Geobacter sp. SVR]GCF84335.1 CHRD domain-containing protein [Geobacter sp. SVR]
MNRIKLLMLAVLAIFVSVSVGMAAEKTFKAKLAGRESVPTVQTKASGDAEFKLSKDGKQLDYKLTVKDIENVTAAHIHLGKKGENGPPVAGIFAGPKKTGKFKGVLAEGVITDKDLMGDFQGKGLDALVKEIKAGNTFVNVHTDAHPDGEIRGQIK